MKRVQYPITDKAKEVAQTLLRAWDEGVVDQYFELADTTSGGDRNRTFIAVLGASTTFELPDFGLLFELSQFKLIVVTQTSQNVAILLTQELRNAVRNEFQVSDYFLTTQAVGTVITATENARISLEGFQSAASVYGNISQGMSNPEVADRLLEILDTGMLQEYESLRESISELKASSETERELKLGKVISQLGNSLQHGANAYVVVQALGFVAQVLK